MNAKQFMGALSVTTQAALKSKEISLPEIIGCLEMTKINVERSAFNHAQIVEATRIMPANAMPPMMPPK